jgi:hypothetical protein
MRKHTLITAALIIILFLSNIRSIAQNFYIETSIGGSYNLLPKNIGNNYDFNSYMDGLTKDGDIGNGSFRSGVNYNLSLGYKISNHFSGELGVSYLDGNSKQSNQGSTFYSKWYGQMTCLTSILKYSLKTRLFTPYIKEGIDVKIDGNITHSFQFSSGGSPLGTDFYHTTTYYGGNSIGFLSSIGCDIKLVDNFTTFIEFLIIIQNWEPSHSESSFGGGVVGTGTINYLNNASPYFNYNTNQPSIAPTYNNPFSCWGFNIGVKYNFGKKKGDEKKTE